MMRHCAACKFDFTRAAVLAKWRRRASRAHHVWRSARAEMSSIGSCPAALIEAVRSLNRPDVANRPARYDASARISSVSMTGYPRQPRFAHSPVIAAAAGAILLSKPRGRANQLATIFRQTVISHPAFSVPRLAAARSRRACGIHRCCRIKRLRLLAD